MAKHLLCLIFLAFTVKCILQNTHLFHLCIFEYTFLIYICILEKTFIEPIRILEKTLIFAATK